MAEEIILRSTLRLLLCPGGGFVAIVETWLAFVVEVSLYQVGGQRDYREGTQQDDLSGEFKQPATIRRNRLSLKAAGDVPRRETKKNQPFSNPSRVQSVLYGLATRLSTCTSAHPSLSHHAPRLPRPSIKTPLLKKSLPLLSRVKSDPALCPHRR